MLVQCNTDIYNPVVKGSCVKQARHLTMRKYPFVFFGLPLFVLDHHLHHIPSKSETLIMTDQGRAKKIAQLSCNKTGFDPPNGSEPLAK